MLVVVLAIAVLGFLHTSFVLDTWVHLCGMRGVATLGRHLSTIAGPYLNGSRGVCPVWLSTLVLAAAIWLVSALFSHVGAKPVPS